MNELVPESLSVLACQIEVPSTITASQRDTHLQLSSHKVSQALCKQKVDLVVLPELSSVDYSRETFDQLDIVAETLDGPSFQTWSSLAVRFQTHVVYSFPLKDGKQYYICVAVVNDCGELVGHYNKLHLAQYGASMEKDYFQCGKHLLTFELCGFKIAPIICYDIRIPELTRSLVIEHEVDFILHCGAYYRDESFVTWHPFTITRAMENQVYLLSLNRAGEHYGSSVFCRPWMDEEHTAVAFSDYHEEIKRLELTQQELLTARRSYSFLKDRLNDYALPKH